MHISVEISLYPFVPKYEKPILDFIERLHSYAQLEIHTNTMSTQIFGPYDIVMTALQKEMKASLSEKYTNVFVLKVLNVAPA